MCATCWILCASWPRRVGSQSSSLLPIIPENVTRRRSDKVELSWHIFFQLCRREKVHMKLRTIYPVLLVPLLCVVLIGALLVLYLSPFTHAAPISGRVSLKNSVANYTSQSQLVSHAAADQTLTLAVGLS